MTTPTEAGETAYEFRPALTGEPGPMMLDLTDGSGQDTVDAAAVAAVAGVPDAQALWRAWWFGPDAGPERVFLIEADSDRAASALLAVTGEDDARVESYLAGDTPPDHLRAARGRSALLWSAEPAVAIQLARVFDRADPVTGPMFDPEHPTMTGPDQPHLVLGYLNGGQVLLATTDRMTDILDPARGAVVPMSYRTDGTWIWTDTVGYYLTTYGLSPDADLLAHIRAHDHTVPAVSAAAAHRALAVLFG
ncbi:hypothetical protein GCM10010435_41080 [Winogradskya consettensis]|uniref:Uncharacterized protein n=1 Tax=Winogradskya consettensis TaxID=113560 RepID=A0A919SQ19_9ACTN|nr:hypothetical protein [Actinoplanes consettensis]GIM76905.1 hypothetical protein Aco04nite_52800 [Actinoplanes consettensis]